MIRQPEPGPQASRLGLFFYASARPVLILRGILAMFNSQVIQGVFSLNRRVLCLGWIIYHQSRKAAYFIKKPRQIQGIGNGL